MFAARDWARELAMWGSSPHIFLFSVRPWFGLRFNVNRELEELVTAELDAIGYDLVDLRRGGSKGRPVVEVRIDRRDGAGVTVDDCTTASRAIEARLDARADLVGERYVLEVSSPGVERPLKRAADWRRFAGKPASVKSSALGGRREVVIVGVEGDAASADGEVVVLEGDKGERFRVPLADVTEARLVFKW